MAAVAAAVGALFLTQLYWSELAQERVRLVEIAQGRARLIEAMASFDATQRSDYPGGPWAATLSQIEAAHDRFDGFGETGEFTLARRSGDQIIFLLNHRHGDLANPRPVPFHSELAEPMRRALAGESGTLVGLDYRGVVVLAAHEPLAELGIGIVAKIDMAEIRVPFVKAILLALSGGLLIIVVGASLIVVSVNPLVRRFEERTEELTRAYDRVKHEVDERTQAEKELKELTRTLERRVAERTTELEMSRTAALNMMEDAVEARRELTRVADDLVRSNEELEQFAHIASHDLQEPLRMVASFTALLGERYKGKLDSDADEFIGYAIDGATRMKELLQALLVYSRVGMKGEKFVLTPCDELLADVLDDLGAAIEESGAVITRDPLPALTADPAQLRQLFQNLIGNALKFYKERPEIHVHAERRDAEWVFSVRDNGIGIEPEYAERIFAIFQRLHGKAEYAGGGLGLAICKRIVERHGGKIWVESQRGEGSTFYFTLPADGTRSDAV